MKSATVLLILVQLWPILVYGINLSDCEDYQYLLNGGNQCLECPACPAGQTYTKHCGYMQDHQGKITKQSNSCQKCKSGYFKSERSVYECLECTIRCGKNREVIHPCNTTHDLKCSDCKKGFYMENGGCYPCQFCCGESVFNPQFKAEFVKDKCDRDGMGHCSCGPIKGCTKKCLDVGKLSTPKPTPIILPKSSLGGTLSTDRTKANTVKPKLFTTSTQKDIVNPITRGVAHGYNSKSEVAVKNTSPTIDPGWVVAVVICTILVSVIVLAMLKHVNIIKKIKKLLLSYDTSKRESRDQSDDKNTVVCVTDRFQTPAPRVITNYAQRVDDFEDNCQTEHSILINHPNLYDGPQRFICSCSSDGCTFASNSTDSIAADVHDDPNAPWVYRNNFQHRVPKRWPYSRAEMNNVAAVNGEYIQLLQNEANSPTTQTDDTEQQLENVSDDPRVQRQAVSCDQEDPENKEGEENSEGEDAAKAIPVTTEAGQDNNALVIATGQNVGTTCHDLVKTSEMPREPWSRKKRKKKQPILKDPKKAHSDLSKEILPSESLRCSCEQCSYRPYKRNVQLCKCPNCVPRLDDDLYKIIERQCLRAEICKELNKKGVSNWRELSIYIRIDKQIPDIEDSKNPAHIVLEKLKTSKPDFKLEDFCVILKKIGRQDITSAIMNHHISCKLCRRNSFDGSEHDLYTKSDSWTLKQISDSF